MTDAPLSRRRRAVILIAMIDWLPRVRELSSGDYFRTVVRAVGRLRPDLEPAYQREIARGVVRHRAINRAVHRMQLRFPRLSALLAKLVPIHVPHVVRSTLESDRPILIAGLHFGPVFLVVATILRVVRGRSVYVLHARNTQFVRDHTRYLERLGVRSVVNDDASLRYLVRVLRTDRRCAVIVAFDHVSEGRRLATIFNVPVAVSHGIAYLADMTGAAVVAACWKWRATFLRLDFAGPFEIDRSYGRVERRSSLMRDLFGLLERQMREAPEQWTEWHNVLASIDRADLLARESRPR